MKQAIDVIQDAESEVQPEWLPILRQLLSSLQFGLVQITVHEGRVVQIERTERVRLDRGRSHSS